MKKKHKLALDEMRDIIKDMETCMHVLDQYTRRVLGRFADIPMEDWAKHFRREGEIIGEQRKINAVTEKTVSKAKRLLKRVTARNRKSNGVRQHHGNR